MAKDVKISFLLDFYSDLLTDKQREAVEFYYNDDLSLSEIAANQGITRQGVRDAIKRAEALLLDMEQRLGLAKRFRTMQEGLEAIRLSAEHIEACNGRYSYSREIHEEAGRIMATADRLLEEG